MTDYPEVPLNLKENGLYCTLSNEMKATVNRIYSLAKRKLKVVDEVLTHFNSHDINHSLRTLFHFTEILDRCRISNLTPEEAFIIICACLLHDVGMGPLGPEEDLEFKEDQLRQRREPPEEPIVSDARIDEWRKTHHLRVKNWIFQSSGTVLDDLDLKTRKAVSEVACAHRQIPFLYYDYFDKYPRLAFLGAVLRLADQMDITSARIKDRFENPRESFKIFLERENPDKPEKQLTEWLKVFADKKWKLEINDTKRELILSSSLLDDSLTMRILGALEELVYDIEKTIEQVKDIPWSGFAIPERLLPDSLIVDFSIENEIAQTKHKLGANFANVWEYLSKRLYPEEIRCDIPIREAVCNAIDACLLIPSHKRENVEVLVEDLGDEIRIHDNGIGMSLEVIENHLKVLASSYYESARYHGWLNRTGQSNNKPSVIGQFGIGTFSYLLISHAFQIETKTEYGDPYTVCFSRNFAVTKKGIREDRGTTLILPCPKRGANWSDSEGLKGLLENYFPKPRIKILFVGQDGSNSVIGKYIDDDIHKSPTDDACFKYCITQKKTLYNFGVKIEGNSSTDTLKPSNKSFLLPMRGPRTFKLNLLYAGMKIGISKQTPTPISFALHTMSPFQSLMWIDLNRGNQIVDLTKNIISSTGAKIIDQALLDLEHLSLKILREIQVSEHIDEFSKFMSRYATIRYLNKASEWARDEIGELVGNEYNDAILSSLYYNVYFVENDELTEFLLGEWPCYDIKNDVLFTLKEAAKEHQRMIWEITLIPPKEFREFLESGKIQPSPRFFNYSSIPLAVVAPPEFPEQLLRYYIGTMGSFAITNSSDVNLLDFLNLWNFDELDSDEQLKRISLSSESEFEVSQQLLEFLRHGHISQFAYEVWNFVQLTSLYGDDPDPEVEIDFEGNLFSMINGLGRIFNIDRNAVKDIYSEISSMRIQRDGWIYIPSFLRRKTQENILGQRY